jgi:hypothetical protein
MTQEIKIITSALASIVSLVAYIPYLVDMFRGKNKPHLYTWISIFLITITVGLTQLAGGGGVGAVPTLIGAVVNGIILFYCFRFGTKDVIPVDKIFLAIAILGAASFLILGEYPALSLSIVTIAEVASFTPTFRKTRNDPYSESLTSYYLLILKLSLILIALEKYNLLTASYSILWILIFAIFLLTTYRWRSKIMRTK